MLNFYHRFLPKAAQHQAILNAYITQDQRLTRDYVVQRGVQALERAKRQLGDATLLAFSQSDAPLAVFVGASDITVGAVLHQKLNKIWQPLSFFSNTAQQAQYGNQILSIISRR